MKPRLGMLLLVAAAVLSSGTRAQGQTREREFGRRVGAHLARHVESSRLAILPLGAIEYHGPSGPPLTDSLIARGIAAELAPKLDASLFPVLHYTACPAHTAGFQGSISVRPETVTQLLEDVLEGLAGNGFRKVLLLNAHSGNVGPAQSAVSQVAARRPELQLVLVSWWETLPAPDVEEVGLFTSGNGGHGHGGPLELSVAAVFAPGAVRPGMAPDLPALPGDAPFPYFLGKSDTAGWPGYSGKLSEIDPEKGRVLADLAVERIAALVRKWLADDSRPGSW